MPNRIAIMPRTTISSTSVKPFLKYFVTLPSFCAGSIRAHEKSCDESAAVPVVQSRKHSRLHRETLVQMNGTESPYFSAKFRIIPYCISMFSANIVANQQENVKVSGWRKYWVHSLVKMDVCTERFPKIQKSCSLFRRNSLSGPSDRTWTCGLLTPSQARYQLRYTRIFL